MSRRILAVSLVLCAGCIVDNPFLPTQLGEGESSTDETGDGDGDAGDGDGDSGPGDGDAGDGDGDPLSCQQSLWVFDFESSEWNAPLALDEVWDHPNAPPCAYRIWATTYLELWDRLYVFSADGNFYIRDQGQWASPFPIAQLFPQLADQTIDSLVYVPPTGNETEAAELLFNVQPVAHIYGVVEAGGVTFKETVQILDEPSPGPLQSMYVREWSLVMADASKYLMDPEWWVSWQGFLDSRVYRTNAEFVWDSWPAALSPLFLAGANETNSPDPDKIEAAWGDHDTQLGYFIVRE